MSKKRIYYYTDHQRTPEELINEIVQELKDNA